MAKDLFPVVDEAWDSEAAVNRWRKYVSSDGSGNKDKVDFDRYSDGFMWFDEKDKENFTSYKLPFVDLFDGNPKAVKKAISSIKGAISGARGGVDISEEDKKKVMKKVEQYEKKMEKDAKGGKLESKLRFMNDSKLPNEFSLELVKLDNGQVSVGNVGIWLTVEIPGLSKFEEEVFNSLKTLIEDSIGMVTDFAGDQLTIKVEDKPSGQSIANETINALKEVLQTFETELKSVQTTTE